MHKFLKLYKNSIYFKFMHRNYDTIYGGDTRMLEYVLLVTA